MKDGQATATGPGPSSTAEGSTGASDRSSTQSPRRFRRSSRSQSSSTLVDPMDEIESMMEEKDKDVPFAPPSIDYAADETEFDHQRTAAAAESAFGGWHWAPLVIALAPPIGTLLGGHADAWSDAILLLLGTFWLYQWMRVPWDMYALSRTRRILQADEEEEEDEQDTELSDQERLARQRARHYSLTELQRTEYMALLGCILSPFVGAYFLTWAQDNLTDGHKYLNAFNIRLFTLAAGIRPWMHGVSLLRRRLLLLQEDVHYPSSRVEGLKRKMKRLESDLSTLRKLVATKSDVTILREGIDVPLSQLSRAVRRNEKKEETLRLSAEDKFTLVEARLDDLLREVAINAELIEEERRERERLASMPLVHIAQAVKLLVGGRASSSGYPSSRPHAIGPGPRPVAQIQAPSSANGSSRHYAGVNPSASAYGGASPALQSDHYQQQQKAWYAKGPMYYVFLPLNVSNAALGYAQSKVSSLLEEASPTHPHPGSPNNYSQSAHPHQLQQAHQSQHAHSLGHAQGPYGGMTSAPSKTRLGKKKAVKI